METWHFCDSVWRGRLPLSERASAPGRPRPVAVFCDSPSWGGWLKGHVSVGDHTGSRDSVWPPYGCKSRAQAGAVCQCPHRRLLCCVSDVAVRARCVLHVRLSATTPAGLTPRCGYAFCQLRMPRGDARPSYEAVCYTPLVTRPAALPVRKPPGTQAAGRLKRTWPC